MKHDFESHVRVHFINNGRHINAIDTGFPIGLEKPLETILMDTDDKNGLTYSTKYAYTHIMPLFDGQIYKFRQGNNTNIMSPRAYTPAVSFELEKGQHIIGAFISVNIGKPNFEKPLVLVDDSIKVTYKGKTYEVISANKTEVIFVG